MHVTSVFQNSSIVKRFHKKNSNDSQLTKNIRIIPRQENCGIIAKLRTNVPPRITSATNDISRRQEHANLAVKGLGYKRHTAYRWFHGNRQFASAVVFIVLSGAFSTVAKGTVIWDRRRTC